MCITPLRQIFFIGVLVALIGCEGQQFRSREAGALGGGALGAGLGAIIGHQTGNPGAGIAIGAAVGALSGGVLGNEYDKMDDAHDERQRRLEGQDRQLAENRRLIEELRKQGADARVTSRGVVVNLPDVLFDFNRASLTGTARSTVQEIARVVGTTRDRRISVEGHTDSVGSIGYNQRLSLDRAHSVASELVREGVDRRRITARGFGETRPLTTNNNDRGRQRNRRVEVIIEN